MDFYDILYVLTETQSTSGQSLMRLIGSHTSRILDSIMFSDFNAVVEETNDIVKTAGVIKKFSQHDKRLENCLGNRVKVLMILKLLG